MLYIIEIKQVIHVMFLADILRNLLSSAKFRVKHINFFLAEVLVWQLF